MKKLALSTLIVLLSACTAIAQTGANAPLHVALEQVQRVEILYFPERVLVRAALTPDRLEHLYEYKIEIRDAHQSSDWEQLAKLLQHTSISETGRSYDHRTAVLLFDKNGRRIASVYFDGFGKEGTIDGKSGAISGGLYQWAKSPLKGVDH